MKPAMEGMTDPHTLLNSVNIHGLRKRVERFLRQDFGSLSPPHIQKQLKRIIEGAPIQNPIWNVGRLFRVRPNESSDEVFNHASQLWYPPPVYARENRCNAAGQPRFYGATAVVTTLMETRVQPGMKVTVLRAQPKQSHPRANVPFIGLSASRSSKIEGAANELGIAQSALRGRLGNANFEKYVLVDAVLTKLITTAKTDANPFCYKPTIALADILLGDDDVPMMLYPSVASDNVGLNVCMNPAAFDRLYSASEAWEFHIASTDAVPAQGVAASPLRRSRPIGANGQIEWMELGEDISPDQTYRFGYGPSIK